MLGKENSSICNSCQNLNQFFFAIGLRRWIAEISLWWHILSQAFKYFDRMWNFFSTTNLTLSGQSVNEMNNLYIIHKMCYSVISAVIFFKNFRKSNYSTFENVGYSLKNTKNQISVQISNKILLLIIFRKWDFYSVIKEKSHIAGHRFLSIS